MSDWSDRTENSPATAAAESTAGVPLAPSVPALGFAVPLGGGFALEPIPESPAPFMFSVEHGDLGYTALRPCGFEEYNLDLPVATEPEPEPDAFEAPAAPAPVIEILTPLPSVSIYEPLEIMDYEDFDEPQPYFESEPEPEPEPAVPVVCSDFLTVASQAIAPAAAKMLQPFGPLSYAEPKPVLIDVPLLTVRARIVRGRNPNAAPTTVAPPEPLQPPAVSVEAAAPSPKVAQPSHPPAEEVQKQTAPEKPKVTVRPTPTPEKDRRGRPAPTQSRPAVAARDRGNAVPIEREEPVVAPPPAPPKPKVMPMPARRPDPATAPDVAPAAARVEPMPTLGLTATEGAGNSGKLRMAIAGAVLAILCGGGYFMFIANAGSSSATEVSGMTDPTPSSLIVGGGGWTTTWGNDAPINKNKQISIYRPSMAMTDYRFEFRGQIEKKALGWIFRASNSTNYYVMKLETIKPGPNPLVALVKYAVINGKETTRTQVMLPFEVKLDTLYQVRLDVKGDKFSTYVQDKLVDYWTDDKIKLGGAGFYSGPGERASIKSSHLSYLNAAAIAAQ